MSWYLWYFLIDFIVLLWIYSSKVDEWNNLFELCLENSNYKTMIEITPDLYASKSELIIDKTHEQSKHVLIKTKFVKLQVKSTITVCIMYILSTSRCPRAPSNHLSSQVFISNCNANKRYDCMLQVSFFFFSHWKTNQDDKFDMCLTWTAEVRTWDFFVDASTTRGMLFCYRNSS